MSAKDALTTQIQNGFKNCFLPNNRLLQLKLKEYLVCESNIIEKDDNHIIVQLLFETEQPIFNFSIKKNKGNALIISDIQRC